MNTGRGKKFLKFQKLTFGGEKKFRVIVAFLYSLFSTRSQGIEKKLMTNPHYCLRNVVFITLKCKKTF